MDEPAGPAFTAGITLADGRNLTVDVDALDADGISYRHDQGDIRRVGWDQVAAVMLATTDHMLAMSGYMLEMAELVRRQEGAGPYDEDALRQRAMGLVRQSVPRLCPLGVGCPLARDDWGRS